MTFEHPLEVRSQGIELPSVPRRGDSGAAAGRG
jgi:hypothetical protein